MTKLKDRQLAEEGRTLPPAIGVSQWLNYGKKYGYDKFFWKKQKEEIIMTKKEIIEFLDENVKLFKETESEDSLGNLYISEKQFIDIKNVIQQINSQKKHAEEWTKRLKEIVNGNERFTVLSNLNIQDKVINLPYPLIFISDRECLISNNVFNMKIK